MRQMFTHKNGYFFGQAGKLWLVFVAVAVVTLLAPYIVEIEVSTTRVLVVGGVALLAGFSLKLNDQGLQINLKNYKYRYYHRIFGFKKGKWKDLPSLQKVVITGKNVSYWNTPNGISPTFRTNSTIYTIALFAELQNPILFFQTENEKEANKKALRLSKGFSIRLESSLNS